MECTDRQKNKKMSCSDYVEFHNLLWMCLPTHEILVNHIPQPPQQLCSICKLFLQFDTLMWDLESRNGKYMALAIYFLYDDSLLMMYTDTLKCWIFFSCNPVISFVEDWERCGQGEIKEDGQRWDSFHVWGQ